MSACSELQLGLSVVEVSGGGTDVGSIRNFTCDDGRRFQTINTSHTVVKCEAHGDWVTYTGERVDNSIEDCTEHGKNSCEKEYILYFQFPFDQIASSQSN